MLNDLEDHVQKLHDCLSGGQFSELARSIISDIVYICGENINPQAINRFIKASGKQILPHAPEIKDTCILIFNSDKYSDVRCSTFPIIVKLLELSNGNSEISSKLNLGKLADEYFLALATPSKLSSSLKANILMILGVICRHHPEVMTYHSNKCLTLFLNTLKAEMETKCHKPDLNVIAGTLEGLNNYLFNFTQSAEEKSKESVKIFHYTKQALLSNADDLNRYAMPRAALDLLAKHASQFDEYIYENYKDLFDRISQWAQHKNYDMKKLAYLTLDAYYKQLAEMLKKKAKTDEKKCKKIFIEFIQKFHKNLSEDKDLKETVISIKGFGAFAGPCREFLETKDVKLMFNTIIGICERTFFLNQQSNSQGQGMTEIFDEKIYQLPSFIESLAYVCNQICDDIPEGSVFTLEKLVLLSIDSYPKLIKRYNHQISLAIARLFLSIQQGKASFYTEFVSRIVYQSMIRIFSYKTNYFLQQDQYDSLQGNSDRSDEPPQEEENAMAKNFYNVTSTDYVMFWSNLLNLSEFQELNNSMEITVNDKKKLISIIYDEFVESLIKIMKKLDLNAVKMENSEQQVNDIMNTSINQNELSVSSNPIAGLRPTRPKDFEILINLVDFSKELLIQKHFDLFEKWMYKISKEVILLSSKHVLISGFYKLNTLFMRIAIKIGYFNKINERVRISKMNDSDIMEIEGQDETSFNSSIVDFVDHEDSQLLLYEKLNCFYLYKKYIKEIYVRMKQFKDELLAACLEFLLSLPKELVVLNLDEVFNALQTSLDLGVNYLPMAENALSSLEYWLNTVNLDKLKPFYSSVLNKFDDYLQMNKVAGTDELAVQEKIILLKSNYKGRGRKRLPVKLFEKNSHLDSNSDLYEQIQFRILKILGQFAGEMSHCLHETNLHNNKKMIAWDTVQHLKFYVPFVDIKPSIYFDRFLPRIVYLALSSTNRQTKVNACELLHAIVIYMIGKSVSDPENNQLFQMTKIYHNIYPALFRLSCDVDHFARNLFQPLVMQMIHWFTGNRKYESADTIELLNCIMESLVDDKDAALRDFSALALKEFLKWSIKHTPLAKQDSASVPSPVNVKSILKRIFNFLAHPSSSKRLGAALAWNSIYVIFREEEVLVNKHIYELLYYLIESLALSEKDDKMYGTQEQCRIGLEHVERIIEVKKDLLNQRNSERVKPPGWAEAVLEVAVRWLMRQCGRTETECRHKSMQLAYKLGSCINGIKSIKEYFQIKYKTESEVYFLARFEGSVEKKEILKDSLCNYKTLIDLGVDHFQLSYIQTWLSMLTAPLDCYSWVFGEKLLTPNNLFSNQKSCIWQSLEYFIENIANFDLVDVIKQVYYKDRPSNFIVCTPSEIEEYNKSKCTAIIRLIDFLFTMFRSYPSESSKIVSSKIWSESLFKLILKMCLDPTRVGFSLNDLEVYTNLPEKTGQFFLILTKDLPPHVQERFKSICSELIDKKCEFPNLNDSLTKLKNSSGAMDWLKLSQLVNGYEQLSEFGLHSISIDLNRILFNYVLNFDNYSDSFEQESLTCVDAKRKLLNLCLNLNYNSLKSNLSTDYLVEILDKYLFSKDEDRKISTFFCYYKIELCQFMLKRYEFVVKYILNKLNLSFSKSVGLLIHLIEFSITDKQTRKIYGSKLVNFLYENWSVFRPYWSAEASNEDKILLINLLTKSILIESAKVNKDVSEMYAWLMADTKTELGFKCKLLDLLIFFAESPAPFQLKSFMGQFVTQLPLKSTELVKGEDSYNDYVSVINKMLVSLMLSRSFDLLNILVSICCRESEHICDANIQAGFRDLMIKLDGSKQILIINQYWENSFKNLDNSEERKFVIFRKVLFNFLQTCSKPSFIEFMCMNIIYLINILDVELKEANFEANCLNKKCVFELIELAYKRLSKDEIFFASAKLCIAYETSKLGQVKDGKELTKEVLRKCRKHLCDQVKFLSNIESKTLEKYQNMERQLHCSAYNCLTALFIRTQTEPKLYLACLFKDDTNKNEFIFEPLIDKNKIYKFSIEMENFQERKTKFVSLRYEFRDSNDQANSSAQDLNYINSMHSTNTMALNPNQVSYLNTQNMYESSLSEELSVFDFTGNTSYNKSSSLNITSTLSSLGTSEQFSQLKRIRSGLYSNSDEIDDNLTKVEIEIDELNQHESMSNFIGLIQSLVANKITPIYEKNQQPSDMPPWMSFLHRKVNDIYTNENVKLFIIRGLINTAQVFRPYAKFWYAPLIGFLVNSSFANEDTMDYFSLDLMVMLLSWHSVCLPQTSEKKLINRLFEKLMRRCYHENRAILKNNLELLKTMTECWKDSIQVPAGIIYSFMISGDQKKIATGIQLFGVVLANQIEDYDYPADVSNVDFYKSLVKCMKDSSKTIHAPSAEVVGMLLKRLELKHESTDLEVFDHVVSYLFEILREIDISLFITCIHRIQLNYPPISERCMTKLVFNLPQLYGEFKLMCAESILSSIKVLDDPLLKTNHFMEMLTHRESSLQLVCLKMIYELLFKQNDEEINRLLTHVCNFISHPYVMCRYQMMLILIAVYEKYQFKVNETDTAACLNIKKITAETLLKALLDEDQSIRLMAQNFWTEKANMPSSTIDRMMLILEKMYSSQTESEYLSYSTNLLLEKTSKSPDYNRLIFENPLSECSFREYNLTADWRRRHEMMTPLFVDTVASLSESYDGSLVLNNNNNLRATQQSLAFQPTQEINKTGAYNWLTQSSVDTFQGSMFSSSLGETQSALLFNVNKRFNSNSAGKQTSESDQDILKLRRRFVREKNQQQNRFFARKQIEKKSKEEELKKQMKLKRLSHVEKYRQYRIGDFPDIQIKFSELIAPLQALAQRDSQIAMILFESLFVSILAEVSYLKDEADAKTIVKNIELNVNSMLNSSDMFNPNFIACLLEISIKHAKSFRLDPSAVCNACLNSLQQSLGIILIEEYLVLNENELECVVEPPQTKRLKLDSESKAENLNSEESILWIELAKLYRSMNDYDSIKGIFMRKSNLTTEYTKNGFYYEANNDYYAARKCYMEALQAEWPMDSEVPKIEEELWQESLLKCCNELTDWKTMCEWSMSYDGSTLKSLFTYDSYSLEHLFPYAFRSKLKLILQEDIEEQKKHDDLIKFIQEIDSDNKKYLEQSFCQEMALIHLHQKDYNAAKYYAHMAIQKFLMEWSSINKTIMQGRMKKLQSLQSIIELNHFLKFIDSNPGYSLDLNKKCDDLINLWSNSMPNLQTDPPCTWDDVITNRCIYFEYIEDKYFNSEQADLMNQSTSYSLGNNTLRFKDDEDSDLFNIKKNIKRKLEKSKLLMKIKFAEAALIQGNHKLALNKLQQTRGIIKSQAVHLADLQIIWMHCYLKTHLARCRQVNNTEESLNMFLGAIVLREILKYDSNSEFANRNDLFQEQQILHANFSKFLIDSLINISNQKDSNWFFEKINSDDKKRNQLLDYIKTNDISNLKETIFKLMKHGVQSLSKIDQHLKGSLELASYCDYFLRLAENEEENQIQLDFNQNEMVMNEFPIIVVEQLLNAIRFNSYEARMRFPRLLQIVEMYKSKVIDKFIDSSKDIPCWMFLGWLSQMTALLDKPEAKAIYHIIQNISNEYPQAFIYPFKMSLESFKFDYDNMEQKEFVEQLKQKSKQVPLANQFIAALEQLTNPNLLFSDYINELSANLKNRDIIFKLFKEIYSNLIDFESQNENGLVEWGRIRNEFAKFAKPLFEKQFGSNAKMLSSLAESDIKSKIGQIYGEVTEYYKQKMITGNLGDYSPWLKNFKRNLAKDLEIPGQYTGKQKPMPEYHVKIESFDERVLEMSSIRRPKCITIRGDDQKEHKFLVKGGEDQRQDQRVETLFELINDLLKADSKCYQRNLSIKTYQVIPMTTKLALIEWLPETKPLKMIFEDDQVKEAQNKFVNFVYSVNKDETSKKTGDIYGMLYSLYSRELVCKEFDKIQKMVPWDLFRRFIRSLSSSTEAYFVLRNQFITSYAVASTCQYILGIGDRHLSNWMIDLKTGRAIGIDFGMAFGHATMNIPVPELMPIRLTRQILKLIAPLEQSGLFESSMYHTLKALRENNDLLMCILDVFIKEPSIDWIGSAFRIAKKNLNEEMQYSMGVQYAKGRVNSAKHKLYGINPCVITKEDLLNGIHKDSKYLKYFLQVLLGLGVTDEESNLVLERACLLKEKGEKYRLSVEEQVRCIIEQSTDLNILGRTWIGWQPFC